MALRERTAPLAAPVFPDAVLRAFLPASEYAVEVGSLFPEESTPQDWDAIYPDLAPAVLRAYAEPFAFVYPVAAPVAFTLFAPEYPDRAPRQTPEQANDNATGAPYIAGIVVANALAASVAIVGQQPAPIVVASGGGGGGTFLPNNEAWNPNTYSEPLFNSSETWRRAEFEDVTEERTARGFRRKKVSVVEFLLPESLDPNDFGMPNFDAKPKAAPAAKEPVKFGVAKRTPWYFYVVGTLIGLVAYALGSVKEVRIHLPPKSDKNDKDKE